MIFFIKFTCFRRVQKISLSWTYNPVHRFQIMKIKPGVKSTLGNEFPIKEPQMNFSLIHNLKKILGLAHLKHALEAQNNSSKLIIP